MNRINDSASVRGAGLRIGVDARLFGDRPTGIGHYIFGLSRELPAILPGAKFICYAPWSIQMPVQSDNWQARIDPLSRAFRIARGFWMTKHAWMLLRLRSLCLRDKINVFLATDAPFIPYLPKSVRIVALVYDLRYLVEPKTQRKATLYVRRFLEKRYARADVLIAISEGTADKLNRFLGYRAEGIVRPAASTHFRRRDDREIAQVLKRYGIQPPYLLSLANADATPHKNTELLIKVFQKLRQEGHLKKHSLVLAGPKSDQLVSNFGRECRERNFGLMGLGYVDGAHLPALYSGADVFIFPSICEGFGMPVLEARACQTTIVASDLTEVREAGGDRAIYIRPDAEGIARGILAAVAADRLTEAENLWSWKSSARILADAIDPG